MPAGASTVINVSEEYESFEQTAGANDVLKRTASSTFVTSVLPAGNPRVDFIVPSRAVAGTEIIVRGSNFSANPTENKITVEGNSRVAAAVLESSANQLKVKIPENAQTGILRVEVAGKASNDYKLDVPFGPLPTLTFGSLANNMETTLKLMVTQKSGELGFLDARLKPNKGSWKTSGFSADAVLGTMKLGSTEYELKTKSSDSSKLVVNGIEKGKTDPDFTVELTNTPAASLLLAPVKSNETVELGSSLTLELNFTQPVFKMPAGAGTAFDVDIEINSLPERTKVKATSLTVSRKQSFTTS